MSFICPLFDLSLTYQLVSQRANKNKFLPKNMLLRKNMLLSKGGRGILLPLQCLEFEQLRQTLGNKLWRQQHAFVLFLHFHFHTFLFTLLEQGDNFVHDWNTIKANYDRFCILWQLEICGRHVYSLGAEYLTGLPTMVGGFKTIRFYIVHEKLSVEL